MIGRKIGSMKKLAKKANKKWQHDDEYLLKGYETPAATAKTATPTGAFAVYVGEERRRFVVPTSYLSHPLLKILLEKSHEEFGCGLVVPCSVGAFQEVVSAVECCNGQFYFGELVDEFL